MLEISKDYWENFMAIIAAFAVLALIIERALYQVFDTKLWKKIEQEVDLQVGGDFLDLKPWISVVVSLFLVFRLKLDMVATIYKAGRSHTISLIITALFLAGGSTGIYKFFKQARALKKIANQKKISDLQDSPPPGGKDGG